MEYAAKMGGSDDEYAVPKIVIISSDHQRALRSWNE
jgi:hypothetical protein